MSNPHTFYTLEELDRKILEILQEDGRISNAELARRINLSQPAAHARRRRLEERGLIRQYVALLDREKVGYDMLCFVRVSLEKHQTHTVEQFREAVQQMPEVLACYFVTGDFDYLLKVVVRNREALEHFLIEKLTPTPGVAHVYTSLVLSEVKASTALPLFHE
ncbi:MAG: Lrp/AsnC family transcriptional regulator [Chloroflexi bacterium]|nr:Lrp/AsnC family transcriptional regulator [Chloroflexota bacterium]